MSKIKLISAVSRNGIIGKNNTLIWKLRKDLAWFKEQTLNTVMIMGRSTFESLPSLLPNREHWVLSRTMNIQPNGRVNSKQRVRVFRSYEEAITEAKERGLDVSVIGGSKVYETALNLHEKGKYKLDEVILTELDSIVLGDTYFPHFEKKNFHKHTLRVDEEFCDVTKVKYKMSFTKYVPKTIVRKFGEKVLGKNIVVMDNSLKAIENIALEFYKFPFKLHNEIKVLCDDNSMAFDFCHRVTQNAFGGKGIVLGQQTKDKIVRRINNDHTVTFNTKFRYNKSTQHLECLTDINNDEWKPFALVRGWGKLHTKMSMEDSAIVQDTFAQMIVNKLNA